VRLRRLGVQQAGGDGESVARTPRTARLVRGAAEEHRIVLEHPSRHTLMMGGFLSCSSKIQKRERRAAASRVAP